jgi:acyl-CoA dehydrogenase
MARQAASALYHLTTAIAMGWEAAQTGSLRRMLLAQLVLRHRLLLQDPLQPPSPVDLAPLFDPGVPKAGAQQLDAMNLIA